MLAALSAAVFPASVPSAYVPRRSLFDPWRGTMTDELIDLVAELTEALCAHMVVDYTAEDYRGSALVERIAQVAAMLQARGRPVPLPIADVLRRAAEAGRPVGVA